MGPRHGRRSWVLFWGTLGVLALSCTLPEFKKGNPTLSSAGSSGTSGEEGVSGASGQSEQGGSSTSESGGAGSEDGGTQGEAGTSQAGQEQAGGDFGGSSSGSNSGGAAGQTSRGGANDAGAADAGGGEPGGDSSGGQSGANTGGSNRGGGSQGGNPSQGGGTPDGGSESGGTPSNGGAVQGGTSSGGALQGGATSGGATSGGAPAADGPCDIYAAADTPCVAAYSMVRRLRRAYTGPLYQVRSDSSNQNTGSGGTVHNIGITTDGFADAAAQDSVCDGTTCTVSLLYDQSGNGNDLLVAKAGLSAGGPYSAMDDFESIADAGPLTVGGHQVYSLYMAARQGYRLPVGTLGSGVPRGTAAQGIYLLADGTHYGTACCWDFGNATTDPTQYGGMDALFLGTAYWGQGAGNGPWFMADFETGTWAGGTGPDDLGAPSQAANPNNPSLKVPFALGFLKTDPNNWSLRMADLQAASSLTTAYSGGLPKVMTNEGGIVLGIAGDNSNSSWGTFFEGAIVSGFPSDATELAVMQNIQDVGYGQ